MPVTDTTVASRDRTVRITDNHVHRTLTVNHAVQRVYIVKSVENVIGTTDAINSD
jgi:hypothetical protein